MQKTSAPCLRRGRKKYVKRSVQRFQIVIGHQVIGNLLVGMDHAVDKASNERAAAMRRTENQSTKKVNKTNFSKKKKR